MIKQFWMVVAEYDGEEMILASMDQNTGAECPVMTGRPCDMQNLREAGRAAAVTLGRETKLVTFTKRSEVESFQPEEENV